MTTVLEGFRSGPSQKLGAPPELDPELEKQLEALGYR